jgi:hypothetical protein
MYVCSIRKPGNSCANVSAGSAVVIAYKTKTVRSAQHPAERNRRIEPPAPGTHRPVHQIPARAAGRIRVRRIQGIVSSTRKSLARVDDACAALELEASTFT